MGDNVTRSGRRLSDGLRAVLGAGLALAAGPLFAQTEDPGSSPAPAPPVVPPSPPVVTDDKVSALDVVATPIDDLKLRKRRAPAALLAAQEAPYAQAGLVDCAAIAAAIAPLDDVLGEDLDTAPAPRRRLTAGKIGREVVGIFIPYRGLIREASGANAGRRRLADLVIAGMMRRAYLKGMGEARGCPYPARPADEETRALLASFLHGSQSPADARPTADLGGKIAQ